MGGLGIIAFASASPNPQKKLRSITSQSRRRLSDRRTLDRYHICSIPDSIFFHATACCIDLFWKVRIHLRTAGLFSFFHKVSSSNLVVGFTTNNCFKMRRPQRNENFEQFPSNENRSLYQNSEKDRAFYIVIMVDTRIGTSKSYSASHKISKFSNGILGMSFSLLLIRDLISALLGFLLFFCMASSVYRRDVV